MTRLEWMTLWDRLYKKIEEGNTSLGKNQVLKIMDDLEKQMIRDTETENSLREEQNT
jgi:hypothetical protein